MYMVFQQKVFSLGVYQQVGDHKGYGGINFLKNTQLSFFHF